MATKESGSGTGIGIGVGTVLGFLCGVGVGLLFAKQTGSETRERISDFVRKGREKGEELIGRGRETVESAAAQAMTSEGGKEPFYESGKYT